MPKSQVPMVAGRKNSLPRIYGDTPTFLGCPVIKTSDEMKKYDVVVMGVPWEGTITWGTYSGTEMAPKTVRHASARYGGYLPEYDVNIFDSMNIGDSGDVSISPSNPEVTMRRIKRQAGIIYKEGAIPFTIGGDHSFTPEIVKALGENSGGKIGIIHLDAHFDNAAKFGDDEYPRCAPLYRISHIPQVRNQSIVHIGIRGPRNSPAQMEYARSIGASVFTIKSIRDMGMEEVIRRAIDIAYSGTQSVYVTICSDAIEAGFNPGGPADPDGLTPHELFSALNQFGKAGIAGCDFVEAYPIQDANGVSSHLACWAFIHALVGMALRKQCNLPDSAGILQAAEQA
jgi:guanidinopropionase